MQEEFRRIIPATSEKPETRVLEARALFDIYKRKVGQEEVTFSVSDLVMMDESFRGNQAFEEDRAWLREQLAGQFDSQNTESKLKIIGHLIDDDPQLAGQLIDKTSEQIKKHHRKLKGSANERDANWDKRQQAAKFERAIGGVVEKVSILEQREEIEDKFGYEHPLDETLTDKRNIVGGEYKRHKIRISHLRVPEVKDLGEVTPEAQWGEVTEFLKQVESPAKFLKRWSGKGIDKRKHFLSERVNEAYGVGVDVITQMNPDKAGKMLLELYNSANTFSRQLEQGDGSREVALPFDRITDPKIYRAFILERSKQEEQQWDFFERWANEEQHSDSKESEKEDEPKQFEKLEQFEMSLEHQLAVASIGNGLPELATDEVARIGERISELSTEDIERLYTAIEKRAETDERYVPLLDQLGIPYHEHLDKRMSRAHPGEEANLIEERLSTFLDPTTDWDTTAKTIEKIKELNSYQGQGIHRTEYFPVKLLDKSIKSLVDLPEDQRVARLELLGNFCNQSFASERYGLESARCHTLYAETLAKYGLAQEASKYAGKENLKSFIAETLKEGGKAGIETLWETKGWDPIGVLSELTSAVKKQESSALGSILELTDRYRTSYGHIGRDQHIAEDTEKIEGELRALITRAEIYGGEYVPPLDEGEVATVQKRIDQFRSLSWKLWQQGHIPSDREVRENVLKIFVEDERDLAVAELGLGANQKVELFIASGKVAIDREDSEALKQAIANAKRLNIYQESEDAQKLVAGLEKSQEMLKLRTGVSEINPDRLRVLFEQSKYGKDKILDALIDSGRYHEAITICSELGQEKIARQLIEKGAFEIAEELINTAPAKLLPNRKLLSALVSYRKAGGEARIKKAEDISKIAREIPGLLRSQGISEVEILSIVRKHLPEDQRLLVDRCVDIVGQEEFLQTTQSYNEDSLKQYYLDKLLDNGRNEEAVRFAVLHGNGLLTSLVKRLAETGSPSEIEPLLYRITDLETAHQVVDSLVKAGQKELAQLFIKRFVGALNGESSVFKNVRVVKRNAYENTTTSSIENRAPEQEQIKNIEDLRSLIFATGSIESLAHICSIFRAEDNLRRFAYPVFDGLAESEVSSRELSGFLSALGSEGIEQYSSFLAERGASKNIESFVEALEILMPQEKAMERYPSIYATSIAVSAREAFVEDVRGLSPQERTQRFIDLYNPEDPKDTILLASISLDKQEWNKFLAPLPNEERERAVMLADWYKSSRVEGQKLGPVIERAATALTGAIESNDLETLRLSLDTLLSARTSDAASKLTRVFLNHLEGGGSTGTTYRLAKTLSGMESFKANTVLSEIMSEPGTPDVLSRYIIKLLVENGHLDPDLRGYFEEKRISDNSEDQAHLEGAVDRFRMLMQKYGINPDSAIMRYTDGRSNEEISASLERMIEQVEDFEKQGKYQELGEHLMGDLNMRLLYFLRNGGRTRFSLINDYNFAKFTNVLQVGTNLELHDQPLETFGQAINQFHDSEGTEQITQRISSGQFPLSTNEGESVFSLTVDANAESQAEQARSLIGNTLGRNEFGAFTRAIMYRSFIDRLPKERVSGELESLWQSAGQDLGSLNTFLEYCESNFGSELEENAKVPTAIKKNSSEELPLNDSLSRETLDVGITKIEPSLKALGKKLTNNARNAAQQKKISKEERDRLLEGYQNPETVLTTLLANELPSEFAPALDEWKSHMQAAIQSSREARTMQRGESEVRQLNLRYLDKTNSLPEYLRFADSAMCCFTSKNFQGTGPQQYIARIWKDPLSFVFHIEEPSTEQTDRRNSVGFVFGSYAVNRENEPVLMLNGVYMDRKTDLAAKKILETIEQQLAKPLGCKEVLTASQHAGRSNYGAEYENTDQEYLRLRAIKQKFGDEPELHTYDDIGLVAVDAKEGRTQDTQVVNRWAKTGKHILRKKLD